MKLPPIVVACGSALIIDCCSNYIAQRLKAWRDGKTPFVFDRVLFFQFAFMVVLTAPVNYHWQHWLERTFPGWRLATTTRPATALDAGEAEKATLKDDGDDKRMVEEEVWERNWFNIFRKWFTDCITMGALLNQSMFLILIGLLKGKTVALIVADFRNELFGLIFDSYKIWPIANFFSTTYCPVERRMIFLSCCGLLWNIYLSLVAQRL